MKITYNLSRSDQRMVSLILQLHGPYLHAAHSDWEIQVGEFTPGSLGALVRQDGTNVLLHTHPVLFKPARRAPRWPWVFAVESIEAIAVGGSVTWSCHGLWTVGAGVDHQGYEFFTLTLAGPGDHDHHYVFRQPARSRAGRLVMNEAIPKWDCMPLRTDGDLDHGFGWLPPSKCGPEVGCVAGVLPRASSDAEPRKALGAANDSAFEDPVPDLLLGGIAHGSERRSK